LFILRFFSYLANHKCWKANQELRRGGLLPSFSVKNKHEAHSCGWKLRSRWREPKNPQPHPIMTWLTQKLNFCSWHKLSGFLLYEYVFFFVCNLNLFEITEWESIKRGSVWFNSFKSLKSDKWQNCQFP